MITIYKKAYITIPILLLLTIAILWNIPIGKDHLTSEDEENSSLIFEVRGKNSTLLESRHIDLNKGNDYEIYFQTENKNVDRYCLMLIIDGEQKEIITSSVNESIFITPNYTKGNIIKFKFPSISKGLHQAMFILKPIVDNTVKNPPEVFTSRFSLEGMNKDNSHIKKDIELNDELTNLLEPEEKLDFRGMIDFAVIPSKDIINPKIKLRDYCPLKGASSFEVYLLNKESQDTTYMLLAFVNDKQYLINNKKYMLIDLKESEEKSFNVSLNVSSKDINKELIFYAIPNIYLLYDNESFNEAWDQNLDIYTKTSTSYIITE